MIPYTHSEEEGQKLQEEQQQRQQQERQRLQQEEQDAVNSELTRERTCGEKQCNWQITRPTDNEP